MSIRAWIYRKLILPFVELLKQGMSPEKIALTVALGISLGVVPVIGSTTTLCTLAAVSLRLNLPAIMLVNGVVYPLQIALLVPFLRAGAWLFRVDAHDKHACPSPKAPEYAAFCQLMTQNQELLGKIEAAWADQGLPTFKTYLRADLARRQGRS